jgi:hypothetical protein
MIRNLLLASVLLTLAASSVCAAPSVASNAGNSTKQDTLFDTISKLDAGFFDAFNHCSSPGELEKHASYLNANVEFYHDKGGVSWNRHDYIAKTGVNVCGHFRRVLTAGSLQVFPINAYGAIEEGRQEFCDIKSSKCFGKAKFLIVWHQLSNGWEITRIFSYGHEAIK